jgi:hypothetical protein
MRSLMNFGRTLLSGGQGNTERLSAEQINNPLLRNLFGYWQALSSSSGFAPKRDFDPINLPPALWPRLFFIEITDDESTYRFTLMGTYVADAIGRDLTGCHLTESEVPGINGSVSQRLLHRLTTTAEPQHYLGPPSFGATKQFPLHEQLLLPLTSETRLIHTVVGGIDYQGFLAHGLGHVNEP